MINKILIIKKKYLLQALLFSLIFILGNVIMGLLINKYFAIKISTQVKFSSNIEAFLMAVLFAPIIETLIFQCFIIYQTYESYKGGKVKLLAISISALFFGLSHFYSIQYVLFGIIAGYFLGYVFCHFREKTNYVSATLYVTIIHLISNLAVFTIKLLDL
jgi:uncharacterized protein